MKKMTYEEFIKYVEDHKNSIMAIINNVEERKIVGVALSVYCFEGEFSEICISLKEAYDDFYEYVVNEPIEIEIENKNGKFTMCQQNVLTIDEVVARGYDSYL